MGLQDIDNLHLLLNGGSVVDWYRLHFRKPESIDAFLMANGFDIHDAVDRDRLSRLQKKSVQYLREHLRYRIPDRISECEDLRELFTLASGKGRLRTYACMTLKVMHIMHYVQARELLSMLALSEAEISVLMHAKVERTVRGLLERGFRVESFSGSAKSSNSLVSKLLAKPTNQSAQVFDRLRFRIVVDRMEDLPSTLLALTRELVPFNYIVPNQSENSLLDLERVLVRGGNVPAAKERDASSRTLNEQALAIDAKRRNEFSGPKFQVVSFVADIPMRVDRVLDFSRASLKDKGSVVFVTVEFQLVDKRTATENERGENKHSLYKERQRKRVKQRLQRGSRTKRTGEALSELPDTAVE